MNAPLFPEVLRLVDDSQAPFAFESEGVLRYVWESWFGAMLIEVVDGQVFVNGDLVVPTAPSDD